MPAGSGIPVPVTSGNPELFAAKMQPLMNRIRPRAYEIFRQRTCQSNPLADWTQAEHQTNLLHIWGVSDEGESFRITGCIPEGSCDIAIEAFPDEIVVEGLHGEEIEKVTRLRMPAPIDITRVHAHRNGTELEVLAPKVAGKDEVCLNG